MLEEHGVVTELKEGLAIIKAERTTACEGCASKKACVSGGPSGMFIEADNAVGARPGDRVVFTIGGASVLKAGVILYMGPVILFIFGVVVGQTAGKRLLPGVNADLVSGVFGASFLVVAFLCLRLYNTTRKAEDRPHILRIL